MQREGAQTQDVSHAFGADANVVRLVAEAHRLRHAYLFNPIFATETSLIDALPHQFIAVYHHLLKHSPLRFLLADDAGAGKTVMTGLYIQELLMRRQAERVLIVPPAGLIGNWERELRVCFRLPFRILSSTDAVQTNPFTHPENHLAIVSLDTLRQERMQKHLFDAPPYDLVVFDEAHKLSARRETDGAVTKSKRYQLAERIAAQEKHLLLLTATPHMGKADAYYFLWRLLLPEHLAAQKAFERLSDAKKSQHLLRRMKEEMIRFNGEAIYPPRRSQTIAYPLKQGEISEQSLYENVTAYCENNFDMAGQYNRAAAKMAMMVLQRRLASSTFALLQSLRRREEKLQTTLRELRNGRLSETQFGKVQTELPDSDIRDEKTGDEEEAFEGQEEAERVDAQLAAATTARSAADLAEEIRHVQELTELARAVYALRAESKFEHLWKALAAYQDTKVLIFTEHRDTLYFVKERLEALGFSGRVAHIHGGMRYSLREEQVEFFRAPDGAQYLVATDAAGEGINLQFCWLMVNYDIPWNPARLEQRMGRIHRYKQTRPVVMLNLVAQETREGRVLKVLLEKLEQMRQELSTDKVFDVIGQQFSEISLPQLITQAITQAEPEAAIQTLNAQFTPENVKNQLEAQEKSVPSSEVRRVLANVQSHREAAETSRMMPAYVRAFFEDAAPLLGYRIEGETDGIFKVSACPDSVRETLQNYSSALRERLTFSRELALPEGVVQPQAIFLHPGEPIFEAMTTDFLEKFAVEGERGAVYVDTQADEPYRFYLARMPVLQTAHVAAHVAAQVIDEVVTGVKQFSDGRCEPAPAHLLLTLTPQPRNGLPYPPDVASLLSLSDEPAPVQTFVSEHFGEPKVASIREALRAELAEKKKHIQIAFNLRKGELLNQRIELQKAVENKVPAAQTRLNNCERELDAIPTKRKAAEAKLTAEIESVQLDEVTLYVRALVTPPPIDDAIPTRTLRDAEKIAIQTVINYERQCGAEVEDVSKPHLKNGFDLRAKRPNGEIRYIEVKGRTGVAGIELTANEWRQAANHGKRYWLYTVYHCDANPQLYLCQDPFANLIATSRTSITIHASDIMQQSETIPVSP